MAGIAAKFATVYLCIMFLGGGHGVATMAESAEWYPVFGFGQPVAVAGMNLMISIRLSRCGHIIVLAHTE